MSEALRGARRIVVKVGSSLVTNEGRGVDPNAVGDWCRQMAELVRQGRELVMVSSGAIAEGMKRLGWPARPRGVHELQAAAAVGQMGLAQIYESALRAHGIGSAQVLLTHADLADRERYLNARSTLVTLLGLGVVPVINENDTVVNDEIKFGDNDTLGALVTNLLDADALVILTDQAGLFSADPRKDPAARLVENGAAGDPALELMAGGAGSALGRGGMLTKILAAKRAARSGASTVIASGRERDVLLRLAAGESIGTALVATTAKVDREEALDERSPAAARRGRRRRRRRRQAARRRQEPAADRRRQRRGRLPSRRRHRRAPRQRRGDRPGPQQLRQRRGAADRAQALVGDRPPARLRQRAGADPPRQPRARLSARPRYAIGSFGSGCGWVSGAGAVGVPSIGVVASDARAGDAAGKASLRR